MVGAIGPSVGVVVGVLEAAELPTGLAVLAPSETAVVRVEGVAMVSVVVAPGITTGVVVVEMTLVGTLSAGVLYVAGGAVLPGVATGAVSSCEPCADDTPVKP